MYILYCASNLYFGSSEKNLLYFQLELWKHIVPLLLNVMSLCIFRYLAVGGSFKDAGYAFRVGCNTICNFTPVVLFAIVKKYREECIAAPTDTQSWRDIADKFYTRWNFPHAVGALDGKHIRIKKPANSGSIYFNYKKFFSIVLMGLVDADYKFLWIDTGGVGSSSDAHIYNASDLKKCIEKETIGLPPPEPLPGDPSERPTPYFLIGDDAFALSSFMMKPYSKPHMLIEERVFNYRLSRARRVVENAFGIMAARWQILLSTIQVEPKRCQTLVEALVCLHNLCRMRYPTLPPGAVDREDDEGNVTPGEWRTAAQLESLDTVSAATNYSKEAKRVRLELTHYLNSPYGSVPWQLDHA